MEASDRVAGQDPAAVGDREVGASAVLASGLDRPPRDVVRILVRPPWLSNLLKSSPPLKNTSCAL
ncbi:hypothetical protein Ntsu_04790 [Nocardia sp. IFM 10818]